MWHTIAFSLFLFFWDRYTKYCWQYWWERNNFSHIIKVTFFSACILLSSCKCHLNAKRCVHRHKQCYRSAVTMSWHMQIHYTGYIQLTFYELIFISVYILLHLSCSFKFLRVQVSILERGDVIKWWYRNSLYMFLS